MSALSIVFQVVTYKVSLLYSRDKIERHDPILQMTWLHRHTPLCTLGQSLANIQFSWFALLENFQATTLVHV